MTKPFIFLDRDGTIIEEKHYLSNPDDVVLLPSVIEGMIKLKNLGFSFTVVSNQSGVGRGYFSLEDLHAVNNRLNNMLTPKGIAIEKFYYCPHAPEEKCDCRKPMPKLIFEAVIELEAELCSSFMIGDKECDIELAINSGLTPVLVRTGYGSKDENKVILKYPEVVIVDNLIDAAHYIHNKINKG